MKWLMDVMHILRSGFGRLWVALLLIISAGVVIGVWLKLKSNVAAEYARLRFHTDQVTGVAFGSDGDVLISAGADGRVLLWDIRRMELVGTLWSHPQGLGCLAVDMDGGSVAAGSLDVNLSVYVSGHQKFAVGPCGHRCCIT